VKKSSLPCCPCGRNGALLAESVEGRVASLTYATDGTPITQKRLDDALSEVSALESYQVLQYGPKEYSLLVVTAGGESVFDDLHDILKALYGNDSGISIKPVDDIKPEASGKFLLAKTMKGR
jgi:hypothetical protein